MKQPATKTVSFATHRRVHQPRNVNLLHEAEQRAAGFNTRIAVIITRIVGNMWCAYAFALLAIIGLLGILGILSPTVILLVGWVSQTFLQLVFLPILSVGQGVLGRKAELQAEEQYHFVIESYSDIEMLKASHEEQRQLLQAIALHLGIQGTHQPD